jgi:hypothetical protein
MSNVAAPAPLDPSALPNSAGAAVNLYWLPLGAGGHCVRLNGLAFEAVSATMHRRKPCDLYHSAVEIQLVGARYVIEMAQVWNERAKERGVVAEGSVGTRGAGRFRLFRYEIRRWRDGRIPTSTRQSIVPGVSLPTLTTPGSSSSSRASRPPCGDVTTSARGTCGTQTRSFPGYFSPAGLTSTTSSHRQAGAHLAGTPAS